MKKHILIILFAITSLSYSCVSREQPDYTTVSASITALNNGQAWSSVLTDTLQNDSLVLRAKKKRNLLKIKVPVATQSIYALGSADVQYFTYDITGNIVTKTFKLDPSYQNTLSNLVSNKVNPINKYVSGQFNFRLVVDTSAINTDTTVPDTVTFTQGQFVATYK